MQRINSYMIGDFKGVQYLYKLGYGYKIYYGKKVVGLSYVYFADKNVCLNKMIDEMKMLSGFNKNLFDLERI